MLVHKKVDKVPTPRLRSAHSGNSWRDRRIIRLLGGFDFPEAHAHGKGHHTYGFLDMGGASAQIAFAPNATEAEKHRNDLKLLRLRTLDGAPSEYKVFVTTWLEYGVNEARRRYVQALLDSTDTERIKELPDPCLPVGLKVTKNGQVIKSGSDEAEGKESYLLGTGKFAECLSQTLPLLDKNAACNDPPCLFHGVHVPAIDFDVNHFVGVSEYWHTTHEVFEATFKDKAYDFHTYQSRVGEFCSQDWSAVTTGLKSQLWGTKFDETTAVEVCFKASWLINMLHEGIGIPRVGIEADSHVSKGQHNGTKEILDKAKQHGYLAPFHAVNKLDDTEVSWTLGKMVLYASSQLPPANNASLAVGFGSNVPGVIPNDFQYAGGRADTMVPDKTADYDDNADDDLNWQDKLLNTSNLPRRVPGFLLVLFIILVAAFLLCGRDRRTNLFRKIGSLFRRNRRNSIGSSPRRRRGLASKLPFLGGANSSGPKYERMMEDGEIQHPSDFELAALSSSSESDDGRSSGAGSRRTPHTGHMTPKKRPSTPSTGAGMGAGGFNAGLGGGASGLYSDSPVSATNVNIVAQGVGLGLGPVGGFRTQSSDRLDRIGRVVESTVAAATGTRSRAGSPTRWRSPLLMPPKESLD